MLLLLGLAGIVLLLVEWEFYGVAWALAGLMVFLGSALLAQLQSRFARGATRCSSS